MDHRIWTRVRFVAVAVAAWGAPADALQPERTQPLSVSEYLAITFIVDVAVSPTGDRVAFVTQQDNIRSDKTESRLWLLQVGPSGKTGTPEELFRAPGSYASLRWSPNGKRLSYVSAPAADKHARLAVVDVATRAVAYTDASRFPTGIGAYDWAPDGNSIVVVSREPLSAEQQRAQTPTYGDVRPFAPHPQWRWGVFRIAPPPRRDAERIVSFDRPVTRVVHSLDGGSLAFEAGRDMFTFRPGADSGQRRAAGGSFVNTDGELLWTSRGLFTVASDARGRGRTQPYLWHFQPEDTLATRLGTSFAGSFRSMRAVPDGSVLAVGKEGTRERFFRLSPAAEPRTLAAVAGQVGALSIARDGKLVAYALSGRDHFPELYIAAGIDDLGSARRATNFNARLNAAPQPTIETIRWKNAGGDMIEGVLFWPPGQQHASRLPLIVDSHGGPWSAMIEAAVWVTPDAVATSYPWLLAQRGFLVLQPNYRGSSGRGDAFLHAIDNAGCSRPAADVIAGVDNLVARGWADSTKMGLMGHSYGGTVTNCVIGRTTRFKAAASAQGIWNNLSAYQTQDGFANSLVPAPYTYIWNDTDRYWSESAISRVARITTPTIVTVGGADRIVAAIQGKQMAGMLQEVGVAAELLNFANEGHIFRRPANKRVKLEAEIGWLEHYILGKPLPRF